MARQMQQTLKKTAYDVVVIGGGSNGTAVARDAAMRGLSVALFEKEDFGYGTVSGSTRLIHGGLRYLELFDFGLVRESLRERQLLLQTAPHLVRPLAFFTPVYRNSPVSLWKLRLGMWLYDTLSWDKSMAKHQFFKPDAAAALEPTVQKDGLLGAFVYYDGHVPMPERLCFEAALQAADFGAAVWNHAAVTGVRRVDGGFAVTVEDTLTAERATVTAKTVVNATGPWADLVNESMPEGETGGLAGHLRLTKGIHLLVPKLSEHAVVMLAESDGRLFFAIPWGQWTYIGTTDTDFSGDLDAVAAVEDEIQYLIDETKRVFPGAAVDTVYLTTAGVRPLVRDARARKEGEVSRKHLVVHHDRERMPGYFSVLGAKITNMRSVAEETVDKVVGYIGASVKRCATRETAFPGGTPAHMASLKTALLSQFQHVGVSEVTVDHLVGLYGGRAADVLRLAAEDTVLAEPITPDGPDLWAQLAFGVADEWVYTTADFLLRRTFIGYGPGLGLGVAPAVARRLGEALGRTESEVRADLADYERAVQQMAPTGVTPPT